MIEILTEFRGTLTAVLVCLIGILGAFVLQRYLAIRNAVHVYKSAFAPEISAISNNLFGGDTFSCAFDRHKDAVDTIRPILSERHQRKLQNTWDKYCGKGDVLEGKDFIQACNMSCYSTDQELFKLLEKRFKKLHSCLDDLL